jgi:hypothetical protein
MRWVFPDRNDREENAAREAVRMRIEAWWKAFTKNATAVDEHFGGREFELVDFMQSTLQAIDDRLMWEFGPALAGDGHRLAISPESAYGLNPMVAEILARAPKVKRFEFHQGRPPEGPEWAQRSVEGRVGVDVSKGSIQVTAGDFNRVNALFFFPGVESEEQANAAAFVAAESLFGEQTLDRWVGAIGALERPEGGGWMPFAKAGQAMAEAIKSVRESLPTEPWSKWVQNCEWSSMEINPPEGAEPDYSGWRDVRIATVPHAEMLGGIVNGALFHSARFSRHDEKFCYLKFDESELEGDARFEFRRPAEDAVDATLRKAALGSLVGGGSGEVFGYTMLALTDVAKAIPLIQKALQQHALPENSWLLFLDYDWCDEWVGLHEKAPPPPMPPLDADG